MIIEHALRPLALSHLRDHDYVYFEIRDAEDGTYAWLACWFKGDEAQLHVQVTKWTRRTYKKMQQDWDDFLVYCDRRGCRLINAAGDVDDVKLAKFMRLFGFPDPQKIIYSTMEVPGGKSNEGYR